MQSAVPSSLTLSDSEREGRGGRGRRGEGGKARRQRQRLRQRQKERGSGSGEARRGGGGDQRRGNSLQEGRRLGHRLHPLDFGAKSRGRDRPDQSTKIDLTATFSSCTGLRASDADSRTNSFDPAQMLEDLSSMGNTKYAVTIFVSERSSFPLWERVAKAHRPLTTHSARGVCVCSVAHCGARRVHMLISAY